MADMTLANIKQQRTVDLIHPVLAAECEYNLDDFDDFLAVVFPEDKLNADEHIAFWSHNVGASGMGFPVNEQAIVDGIFTGVFKHPKRLYFATATVFEKSEGVLRHGSKFFYRHHVLVFDDIGTKVDAAKLPEALANPTYIIETSKGNYQYGYVWKTPIEELREAKAIVDFVYSSGLSDSGGNLPIKAVRLPFGVNGKMDKVDPLYGAFKVRLVSLTDNYFTPRQIAEAIDPSVDYDTLVEDSKAFVRRTSSTAVGSSQWVNAKVPSADGVVDPIAEWLYETNRVEADNGLWIEIECPNASAHTSGGSTAGYRPLGRGDDPTSRAFHCMHGHCTDLKTPDFLAWAAKLNAPRVPIREEACGLTSTWVYDAINDSAVNVRDRNLSSLNITAFKRLKNRNVSVIQPDGSEKLMKEAVLWENSQARVDVYGKHFDASVANRFVMVDGLLKLNTYTPPRWGGGKVSAAHIDKFLDFVEYLVPDNDEREFLLDHLAAKAQNMAYRGVCIVMVAQSQGTGRNTFADQLKRLFDPANVTQTPFSEVVDGDRFNEWQTYPIVICDEALDSDKSQYKAYERLKEVVDLRTKRVTINPKHERKYVIECCSSMFIFSNHGNAVAMATNDRRMFVISNPTVPAPAAYFDEINEWMDAGGWEESVWAFLRNRKINLKKLHTPQEMTAAKREMLASTASPITLAIRSLLKHCPTPYISTAMVKQVLQQPVLAARISLADTPSSDTQVKRELSSLTAGYSKHNVVVSVGGRAHRPKIIISRLAEGITPDSVKNGYTAEVTTESQLGLVALNESISDIANAILADLDLLDI